MNIFESLLSPVGKIAAGAQNAFDDAIIAARKNRQLDKEAEIRNKIIALEQQKQQAQNPQTPLRPQTFGTPEQLELMQAYGKADIDPIAMLKAKTFEEELAKVENPAARINIAAGKEYKPVSQSGGVFFNPYDASNPLIGTTDKYSAQTREAKAKADEAEIRQQVFSENINQISNPLLALDAAQDKAIFDAQKVEIEGEDGTTRQGFATLTPSGEYVGKTVKDTEGKPLKIPTESSTTKPTADMQNVPYFAKLWNVSEGEAARILKSRASETPEQAWSTIVRGNVKNPTSGRRLSADDIVMNSLEQWVIERPGEALPKNIKDSINNLDLSEKEKTDILAKVETFNQAVAAPQAAPVAQPVPTPAPVPAPPASAPPMPPPSVAPVPVAPVAAPPQAPPQPEPQPLTPVAIQTAWSAIQQGKQPEEVQKALVENGFDISPDSVNRMAIDAVNAGVPANVLQQYLASIGIEWKP